MHELWLCQSILEIIQKNLNNTKGARVKKLILKIGQLAGVEKDSFLFNFSVASRGTVAEDAELQIIQIPAEALCETCKKVVPLQNYYDECKECGGHLLTILSGEEFFVQSMVVE